MEYYHKSYLLYRQLLRSLPSHFSTASRNTKTSNVNKMLYQPLSTFKLASDLNRITKVKMKYLILEIIHEQE